MKKYFTKEQLDNPGIVDYIEKIKACDDHRELEVLVQQLCQAHDVKPINAILFVLDEGLPIDLEEVYSKYGFSEREEEWDEIDESLPACFQAIEIPEATEQEQTAKVKKQLMEGAKEMSLDDAATLLKEQKVRGELIESDGNVFYHDGDLTVESLNLKALGIDYLIVNGNLNVDKAISINDDPWNVLFVAGDINARNLVTSGYVGIGGNLTLSGCLVGDYNDGRTTVLGDLDVACAFSLEYYFVFEGKVKIKYDLTNVSYDLDLGTGSINCISMLLKDFFKLLHPTFLACIDTSSSNAFLNSSVQYGRCFLWNYIQSFEFLDYIRDGHPLFKD